MQSSVLAFAILLAGCSHASADPKSAGEVRTTGTFTGIDIIGTMDVEARIGPTTTVEVRGDASRFPQVTTVVKNGVLVIDTKGKLDNAKLRVFVTTPDLSAVAISGTGDLTATGIANNRLAVRISGTGAIVVSGTTDQLRLSVAGTGNVNAKQLIAASASVDIKGTGDADVHATKAVEVAIAGTGALRVYGKPASVKKSITGTASVDLR